MNRNNYIAPSRMCGDYLGVKLHDDWGLAKGSQPLIQIGISVVDGSFDAALCYGIAEKAGWGTVKLDRSLYHIAYGIVSQFCREDIEYFLAHEWQDRPAENQEWYESLLGRLPQGMLQWVPAPSTMRKIEMSLQRRQERAPLFPSPSVGPSP